MNGGPGAPAFLYVNQEHFHRKPILAGWFGCAKDKQFQMSLDFLQATSAGAWQISTPVILSMGPIEGALRISLEAGIEAIRQKSLHQTGYLFYLLDNILSPAPYCFQTSTPRDPQRRGGHIALERAEDARAICSALKSRGVIPDFRPPNMIRFAPVALYNTYHEIWQAVHILKNIIDTREYEAFRTIDEAVT